MMREHIDFQQFLGTLTDDDFLYALDYIDLWTTGQPGTRATIQMIDARLQQTLDTLLRIYHRKAA